MSGLLNVGARALLANQVAIQTAGNNISNVNTAGYSRQTVVLQTVEGQYTGGGYIGKGVDIQTITRNHNEFLTRQATLASAVQASDSVRSTRLTQLEDVFAGGTSGLGAAVNDMLNAFSDVASTPTDLTARNVALARMDETAGRFRSTQQTLNDLRTNVQDQLRESATNVNSLASQIAQINEQIQQARGNGQTPNDLLDKRDQLVRDLNQYIQTSTVDVGDGSISLFVAGSMPLVLGTHAAKLEIQDNAQFPGSDLKLTFVNGTAAPFQMDDSMLGGGEIAGLLRFHNSDLKEAENLLGRMALAIGTSMNQQHELGLTPSGTAGQALFDIPALVSALTSTAGLVGSTVTFADVSQLAASDYEVRFDPTAAPAGKVIRLSDGKEAPFASTAALAGMTIDGLQFNISGTPANSDRVLFRPFATAASTINAKITSPRDLAVASPVEPKMGATNGGSLTVQGLNAVQADPNLTQTVTLTFTSAGQFNVTGTGTGNPTGVAYTTGDTISYNGWQIKLTGVPKAGDTLVIQAATPAYAQRNAGNAQAMLGLRDQPMFDGATLSDGYAGLLSQIGTRSQSAQYAAKVSDAIATNLEKDRTAVSGVNLDEEAAKLIQYQQAYQASAKMIQIAQNIFDTLIQGLAR